MKDEVKITVIATGFKTDNPQRRERTKDAAAISNTRTFVPCASADASAQHERRHLAQDRAAAVAAAEHDALSMLPEMPPAARG